MFINAFTLARQLSLSSANSIQSLNPHHTSWTSILISSSHLCLGLNVGSTDINVHSPLNRVFLSLYRYELNSQSHN
jgi:hypothetical protein